MNGITNARPRAAVRPQRGARLRRELDQAVVRGEERVVGVGRDAGWRLRERARRPGELAEHVERHLQAALRAAIRVRRALLVRADQPVVEPAGGACEGVRRAPEPEARRVGEPFRDRERAQLDRQAQREHAGRAAPREGGTVARAGARDQVEDRRDAAPPRSGERRADVGRASSGSTNR